MEIVLAGFYEASVGDFIAARPSTSMADAVGEDKGCSKISPKSMGNLVNNVTVAAGTVNNSVPSNSNLNLISKSKFLPIDYARTVHNGVP